MSKPSKSSLDKFNEAYDKYFDLMCRLVRHKLPDYETAKDVVQTAFMKLWMHIDEVDSPEGFIKVASNNLACDFWKKSANHERKVRPRSLEFVVSGHAGPDCCLESKDDVATVREAIDQLKPRHREILNCVYCRGMSGPEAAKFLCKELGDVYTRTIRARQALKELLEDKYDGQ